MRQGKRFLSVICLCIMISLCAHGEDNEFYLRDIPAVPYVVLLMPDINTTYERGGSLHVSAKGVNVDSLSIQLEWIDEKGFEHEINTLFHESMVEHTFEMGNFWYESLLTVTGELTASDGSVLSASVSRSILSPKEDYINRMISLAEKNAKQDKYKFAPAEKDTDIGVCKNFVMRLFDTFKKEYRMFEYPDLVLHMPKNNSKVSCAPYDYGIEWRPETAADGSPFEIVYQFKYDDRLSKDENAIIARKMMQMVKKGDFFQMVGYYGGGNGPHSLFFIQDYDPVSDLLYWTDSNMRGKRINGDRWGYLQFDASATAEWYVNVFNMKKRGATLYRLRDDLYRP